MEFRLKEIQFFGRSVAIVCQNENGPCPLIAIANVLSLRGKISISIDKGFITLEELTQLVAEEVLRTCEYKLSILESKKQQEQTKKPEEEDLLKFDDLPNDLPQDIPAPEIQSDLQEVIESVFNILPGLANGLDINVYFHGVNSYEFTPAISIFDALDISLVHGWIVDKEDEKAAVVLHGKSYNHLMFSLIEYKTISEKVAHLPSDDFDGINSILDEKERSIKEEGEIIEAFLDKTASQLSKTGLLKLYEFMADRQLAVFFRNNHFSTIFSYNGQLFLLLTDLGFLSQSEFVWELLVSTDGKTDFFNDHFISYDNFLGDQGSENTSYTRGTVIDVKPSETPRLPGTYCSPPSNQANINKPHESSPIKTSSSMTSTSPTSSSAINTSNNIKNAEELDPELKLYLELQRQEDNKTNPSTEPLNEDPSAQFIYQSNLIDQEELDQQYALMLHYQEMKQNHPTKQSQATSSAARDNRPSHTSHQSSNKSTPNCILS